MKVYEIIQFVYKIKFDKIYYCHSTSRYLCSDICRGAETTIFCDKYPPIGSIEQAEDRFVASTKDKSHKNHKIIELMISGTFDEQIYKLLEQRKSETDIINNYNLYLKKGEKNVQ